MNELQRVRALYLDHETKLRLAASTSDDGRQVRRKIVYDKKVRCLEIAALYMRSAIAIEALIAQ